MSGHSKWSKIKRSKGVKDQKRGALFTKIAKNISLAAKEGGGDLDMNFSLRLAVDKAKIANMPSNNIERAIKKGTGEGGEGITIERISYEAIGFGGASLIIDCQTDNTNRTVADVKNIVESNGGTFASIGSVSWKFDEKGMIVVLPSKKEKSQKFGKEDTYVSVDIEDAQMEIMEIEGILDIKEGDDRDQDDNEVKVLELITKKNSFANIIKDLEKLNYKILSTDLAKLPKDILNLSKEDEEKNNKLVEEIEENDDVDSVWGDY